MIRVLDRADLVLVAAEALGTDPGEVAAAADVAVLAGLEARLRTARTVAAAIAEALVGVAAGRPFAAAGAGLPGNRAVAWLAAAHLAARNRRFIDIEADAAVALVLGAEDGSLDERFVTGALHGALRPCGATGRALAIGGAVSDAARAVARASAAALRPEAVEPPEPTCPLCARPVDPTRLWLVSPWHPVPREQAVRACVRQHGAHDRAGAARRPAAARPRRCPVVLGPAAGTARPFVAITDGAAVAFRPAEPRGGRGPDPRPAYDLIPLDDLAVSDLVGPWDRLWADRTAVARVTVAVDPGASGVPELDWDDVRPEPFPVRAGA